MADNNDPPIVVSPLSRFVSRDDIRVQVAIFKLLEDDGWTLEVVSESGTSTVWEETFATDLIAFDAFLDAVATEGMVMFLDDNTSGSTTIH